MEKEKKVKIVVEISEGERRRLKAKLAKEGKSIQDVLYTFIQVYLKKKGKVKHGKK
jgi:hypothetical protein